MSITVVFISGPPGSGKTAVARQMASRLSNELRADVRMLDANSRFHTPSAYRILLILSRNLVCAVQLYFLIRSASGLLPWKENFLFILRQVVRLIVWTDFLRSLHRTSRDEVLLVDEPSWHRLWATLFPLERAISEKHLIRMIEKLLSKHGRNELIINLVAHPIAREKRLRTRVQQGSRFGPFSSRETFVRLSEDKLYSQILAALKSLPGRSFVELASDENGSVESVAANCISEVLFFLSSQESGQQYNHNEKPC